MPDEQPNGVLDFGTLLRRYRLAAGLSRGVVARRWTWNYPSHFISNRLYVSRVIIP
jgi:hypothetical protein